MAWMMVPAGMPAAIIGSMTCSRMNASERPVLKMTGIPAVASATRSAMIAGLHVAGHGTRHRAVDVEQEGQGRGGRQADAGVAAAGNSGAVMAPLCQPGRVTAPDVALCCDRMRSHGHCLATTLERRGVGHFSWAAKVPRVAG